MASTWSGFTSQKCISTSQVYCSKLSFLEIKKTRENVKLLLLSNCNQFIIQLKIKFIVHSHACSLYLQLTQQQQETQLYCYRHYFFLWLLTDSILKFWLPDTKVEDESLQVGLSLQTLQNIRFPSKSYVSHLKSFSHDQTNFRVDEDWDFEESSIALFEVEAVDVWDDSDDFDDARNALIPISIFKREQITRGRSARQSRFAFQDGGQAFFDSIASWVCDLFPCFLDQASQYGGERTRTFRIFNNYSLKSR